MGDWLCCRYRGGQRGGMGGRGGMHDMKDSRREGGRDFSNRRDHGGSGYIPRNSNRDGDSRSDRLVHFCFFLHLLLRVRGLQILL